MCWLFLADRGFLLGEFVLMRLFSERLPAGPGGSSCKADELIFSTLISEQLLAK